MNLTLTTTQTIKTEIEINLPAFYKSNMGAIIEYVGILDVDTMVRLYDYKDHRTLIEICTTDGYENEVAEYHNKFDLADEEEFFEVYNRLYKSISLKPEVKYYANGMINATI